MASQNVGYLLWLHVSEEKTMSSPSFSPSHLKMVLFRQVTKEEPFEVLWYESDSYTVRPNA